MTPTIAFILGAGIGSVLTIVFAIIIAGSGITARELVEIDEAEALGIGGPEINHGRN